jgi:DNA-binding ferritin-like protein (Dps family)
MIDRADVLPKEFEDVTKEIAKVKIQISDAGKQTDSLISRIGKAMKSRLAQQVSMYLSLQDFIRYGREMFDTVRNLDTALIDLRKTTTMTSNDLEKFYIDANESAKQYGVTTEEIIRQAADWSRFSKIDPLYGNI